MAKKIIIIDDDPVHSFILQQYFEELEIFDVKVFYNGKEALDYFKTLEKQDYPNLVFLDLKMPVMDGFEMLRIFEEEHWCSSLELQLIVLTTSLRKEDRMLSNSFESVSDYLTKPVSLEKIKTLALG